MDVAHKVKDSRGGGSGAAWSARAADLADWSLIRLVNRADACGGYYARGQVTRRVAVDRTRLIRHYRARGPDAIVGLHSADADNRGRWGALDIDQHGDDPARAEANRRAALHWYADLVRRGFRPLLTESNGRGGYHLRLLLAEAIDAARLFHFLRRLTADHRQHGLPRPPEQFPKQRDVRRCAKGLGNWLRLLGRHHTRGFWSRIWDGSAWRDGHAAIDYLLALEGDPPQLVPDAPPAAPSPRRSCRAALTGDNLARRIAAYVARLPNLGAGEGRDDVAFRLAAWLVRDLALSDAVALGWLERWDAGNAPPKGRAALAEILKNARAYGRRPVGCAVESPPSRSVQIIPARRSGHYVIRGTVEIG